MRRAIIKQIFKKEIKEIFRDKKTIFMMVILPILLYPVVMLLLSQVMMYSMNQNARDVYKIAVDKGQFHDDILENILKKGDYEKIEFIEVNNKDKALQEEEIDAYIEMEQQGKEQLSYKVYMNSAIDRSSNAGYKIENLLRDYKAELIRMNLIEAGLDPEAVLEPIVYEQVDTAPNEQKAGQIIAMILPLILVIGILLGALYPAIDVMAGEKERGTIETLLTLPVANMELIVGKFLAVAVVSIMSALLNIISIVASCILMVVNIDSQNVLGEMSFDFSKFIGPFMITLICVLLFALIVTAVSMCVCGMAKSFKEAQNYATPLMLILMLPSYASMIPSLELNMATASIPVVNIALLIKSVLTFQYDLGAMAMVLLSNIGFLILALVLLAKMFDSEEILFGSGKEFALLQRRYNIEKGSLPTPSDSLIIYVVALLGMIYVGSIIQMKLGFLGLALTQILLVALPVLFGWYLKTDFKRAFSLYRPRLVHVIGALVFWIGLFFISNGIANLLMPLASYNQEVNNQLTEALMHDNLWINLLVVAVMPAICEEMLFRGMIYKGLENKGRSPKRAILLSGILFGLMHMDFIRMIPTAILGIGFAYVLYKSGSIFLCMLMHLFNNGIIVLVQHLTMHKTEVVSVVDEMLMMTSIIYIIIGVVPFIIGLLLLKQNKNRNR